MLASESNQRTQSWNMRRTDATDVLFFLLMCHTNCKHVMEIRRKQKDRSMENLLTKVPTATATSGDSKKQKTSKEGRQQLLTRKG